MRGISAIIVVVALAGIVSGQAGPEKHFSSEVVALENVVKVQAFQSKDLRTLDTLLDAQFVSVDQSGRERQKSEFLYHVQSAELLHYSLESIDVRLHGETAIATGLFTISGVDHGSRLVLRGRFVDTWLRKQNRWVAVVFLETPLS